MQLSRSAPSIPNTAVSQTILGIDPSLRGTGYGVIVKQGSQTRVVTYGVIKNTALLSQSACLAAIHAAITGIIAETKPDIAALEGVIYLQNFQTAITLGAARGAALLAIAQAGLTAHEYAPRRIKAATTGSGSAQKYQVSFMMRALLGLKENPPPDAADALAVALTHAQNAHSLKPAKQI
jgi:crossover junction endodeoxyribonuclease RuvC